MKLDFNVVIKDLDGKPIKDADTLGKIIASHIANTQQAYQEVSNPHKLFGWSVDLWNNKSLDLDKSDLDILKIFIEKNKSLSILQQGQALEVIHKAEIKNETVKKE